MKLFPIFSTAALLMTAGISRAQWFQTTYALKGGWNAVYLHGDATHASPDALFPNSGATAGVVEIWRWNARPNQVQFNSSPLIPSSGTPEWAVWKRGLPAQSNLSLITGQTAYLVKCTGTAATAHNIPLTQRALPPSATWVRSGANLLGFPSRLTTPNFPSFSAYFQAFPAAVAANSKIYKYAGGDLGPANPLQVFSPTIEQVDRNKAYWFEAEVVGNFFAPLDISLSTSSGIDFGRSGSVVTALLRNTTAVPMTVTLAPVASIAAPAGQTTVIGAVPLTRRTFVSGTGAWTETAITAAYTEVIGPNSTVELSFGVNRAAMSAASNALYASLLRLTDSANLFDISLPVSARVSSMAGLWVGDATVTNVSSQVQTAATATAVLNNGVVTGINLTGGGFGYSAPPVPVISAPTGVTGTASTAIAQGVPATAIAAVTDGAVSSILITGGGSGYAAVPAVSITPPSSGTTATATAAVTGGVLTGITINNGGTGYTSPPEITFAAPGNVVSRITLTNPGSGYAIAPTVTVTAPPAGGTTATAVATVSNGVLTGLALTNPGAGYLAAPGITVTAPPSAAVPAAAVSTVAGGALTTISVTNPGAGYFAEPTVTVAPPASGETATAVAQVKNGRVTGITITDAGSGYTAAPVVTVDAPPARTTASVTAIVQNGKVTGFTVHDGGSGYLAPPAVTVPAPGPQGTATARTPPLRLILHVEDTGTARLLSQVFVGKLADGASGLCTRESGLDAAARSSASRLVAAHLPLDRVVTSGSGTVALGQTLVRTVTIPFDDETNPFVHRYHPDHDNKDARGRQLGAGVESSGITRTFSFQFTSSPPAGVSATGWGSLTIGGNYTEVIKGLHKQDLVVTGTFMLRRASETGTLTVN